VELCSATNRKRRRPCGKKKKVLWGRDFDGVLDLIWYGNRSSSRKSPERKKKRLCPRVDRDLDVNKRELTHNRRKRERKRSDLDREKAIYRMLEGRGKVYFHQQRKESENTTLFEKKKRRRHCKKGLGKGGRRLHNRLSAPSPARGGKPVSLPHHRRKSFPTSRGYLEGAGSEKNATKGKSLHTRLPGKRRDAGRKDKGRHEGEEEHDRLPS